MSQPWQSYCLFLKFYNSPCLNFKDMIPLLISENNSVTKARMRDYALLFDPNFTNEIKTMSK